MFHAKGRAWQLIQSAAAKVEILSRGACFLSVICCAGLAFLTFEQSMARAMFDAPNVALQELQWHLFGAAFLLAGAEAYRTGAHVQVDILSSGWSAQRRLLLHRAGTLLFVVPTCAVLMHTGWQDVLLALSFDNPHPVDHWTHQIWPVANGDEQALTFAEAPVRQLFAWCETFLRSTLLRGEISADPGGLEARYLIKGLVPLSALLVLLQALAQLVLPQGTSSGVSHDQ